MSMKSTSKYLLIIILIIAALLRFHGLAKENVWLDEAFSIYHSKFSINHIITLDDNHPPLYGLILFISLKIFGASEFSARLPSVIFGILSVLLIYLYGKYAFTKQVGVIASLLLALSSYHISYSQEARMYSLLGFLSLASLYFYVRFRDSNSLSNSTLYLVSSILLIYTHYFGTLVVIVQNIHYFLLTSNKKMKKWIFLQVVLIFSYIPWIFRFISRIQAIYNGFWIKKSYLFLVFMYPFIYSGGITLGIIYFSLFLYSTRYYLKNIKKIKNNERSQIELLLLFIFIPIIIAIIYSITIKPILSHQYVIYSSLGMFIVIAYGINKIRWPYKLIIMSTVIVISLLYISIQNQNQLKYKWKDTADYVKSMVKPNDVIVIFPGHHVLPFLYYFDN